MKKYTDAFMVFIFGGKLSTIFKTLKRMNLVESYSHNPLRHVNVNTACICGSGKKVKKCCGKYKYVNRVWANDVVWVLSDMTPEQKKSVGYKK